MEDIGLLLSYIETEVLEGKKSFLSGGTVVNGDAVLDYVKRLRQSVREATGEDIVERATQRAQNIVSLAEERKAQLLDENIIIREAKAIAEHMLEEAIGKKKQMEAQINAGVTKMLQEVGLTLNEASLNVRNAIDRIVND